MILLRPDCLVFETLAGENIPCAVSEMTIELIGDALEFVDSDIVQNAAHAVLHYFKNDLGRTTVTLREFSSELEKVLRSLGIQVQADPEIAVELPLVYSAPPSPQPASPPVHPQLPVLGVGDGAMESDLEPLAAAGGELFFYPKLREELRRQLSARPKIVRFRGLRPCVKQLRGTTRWSAACQRLQDQVVDYLRTCLHHELHDGDCALLVH